MEIGNVLFYNDMNVINEITYYYKVSAVNSVGEGPLSNEVNATPKAPYVPINQLPTSTISSPSPGEIISGIFEIYGTSSDIDGTVQRVEIKIDNGDWIEVYGTARWDYNWDTTELTNGQHMIYIRSYDGLNYSSEASVNVKVDNQSAEDQEEDLWWIWILIAIIIVQSIVIFLLYIRNKKTEKQDVEKDTTSTTKEDYEEIVEDDEKE